MGPESIARAVLSSKGYEELQEFLKISPDDEPILVVETARHGLVSDSFVRNTAPDWISAEQGGLPIALRDSDLIFDLADDLPDAVTDGVAMIVRTDRRLGFDPAFGLVGTTELTNRAIATSSPAAMALAADQSHILNPIMPSTPRWSTVSVQADSAAITDAASTAFCLMSQVDIQTSLRQLPGHPRATLVDQTGVVQKIS